MAKFQVDMFHNVKQRYILAFRAFFRRVNLSKSRVYSYLHESKKVRCDYFPSQHQKVQQTFFITIKNKNSLSLRFTNAYKET